MKVQVKIGIRGIFKKANDIAPRAMDMAANKAADNMLERIKGKGPKPAPYRTGNLRNSYEKIKFGRGVVVRSDPAIAPYAVFVEFGTRKMAARPHFRPAARAARKEMRVVAERVLNKEFKKL